MALLRSILFAILGTLTTIFYGLFTVPLSIIAHDIGYACAKSWGRQIVRLAKYVCGIDYQVWGIENLPKTPSIIMSKHQSAWETVGILMHVPQASWIIKKELVVVPIIGWVLAGLRSIAIDRKSGKAARDQILEQGRDRISKGNWVVIFPEGTRVAPGQKGRYGIGGAWLAAHTRTAVVPIAHNAGEVWRRNAFIKYPGLVTMSIGPAIETAGLGANEISQRVQDWIENEMARLPATRH
jgi:1-acyl-sn-glycerol-3-phosphate acyltransferase